MPQTRRPRKGSMGYSPRKRARSITARISQWPEGADGAKLQGFAGYKAGMTHAFIVDFRPRSTTAGQEVQVPVTVLEVPPVKVCAVRFYQDTAYGRKAIGEVWAKNLDKELARRLPIPKEYDEKAGWATAEKLEYDDVRALVYTQPVLISGLPKKRPELMEIRIGGAKMADRLSYAKGVLGKAVTIKDFIKEGEMVDVASITKGKGWQGTTKRWGTKLLMHKNSKHRRLVGTLGTKRPNYVRPTVPQGGQIGFHQRTELNKRVLKIGENGEEVTPKGGFLHYGTVRNSYVILHGSVPGPSKRMVRLREPVRAIGVKLSEPPQVTFVSLESKQGV
ncbi:MAG: 50S ribosomal protein L3 [Thermoplasmatota archaeon]|nr:50S ribosomal protein L3 [Candidatus Thermoplasmatota archaeon]MBU1913888.1 50S ribosomal protein L3 [Candidatus Thermoplasmatota archaeon]